MNTDEFLKLQVRRYKLNYELLSAWERLKDKGISLADYFIKNEYRSIAIYGAGEIGWILWNELNNSGVQVKYLIDYNPQKNFVLDREKDIKIVHYHEEVDRNIDAIVITTISVIDIVQDNLNSFDGIPHISLEEVVYKLDKGCCDYV